MITEINKSFFEEFPALESERLILRMILPRDSEDILIIRSNDKVMEFMDRPQMISLQESEEFIKSMIEDYKNQRGINWGIIEKATNKFIGYFGFWKIKSADCRGEIGFALKPDYWGNGYMSETMVKILTFGFKNLMLHSIEANVNPKNKSSIKLLEKHGFQKEAYFRENILFNNKFIDSIIYSLLEKDLRYG